MIKLSTWSAALQKLKAKYANDMIIYAFFDVLHYAVTIVTVCKVRSKEFCCEFKLMTF